MFGITFAKKPQNYRKIDDFMSRSAVPATEGQMKWLKKLIKMESYYLENHI